MEEVAVAIGNDLAPAAAPANNEPADGAGVPENDAAAAEPVPAAEPAAAVLAAAPDGAPDIQGLVLDMLAPAFQVFAQNMHATFQAQQDAQQAAVAQQIQAALRGAHAVEEDDAKDEAKDALEGDGADPLLPLREVPLAGGGQRLRGGVARLAPRIEALRRVLRPDLSPEELGQPEADLALSAQVRPSRMLVRLALDGRPRSTVTQLLSGGGVLPYRSEADQAMAGLMSAFKAKGKSESKAQKFDSFGAFYSKMAKLGMFSQELLTEDPEAYWESDWLLKCVLHILGEYDWTTASTYYEEVMKRWDRIDVQTYCNSDDFKEGDYEAACYMPALNKAIFAAKKGRSQGGGGGASRGSKGTESRVNADDTHCSFCKRYFLKSSGHTTATCRKKQAADKAAGRG